jgi:uncharacterized protein YkwD
MGLMHLLAYAVSLFLLSGIQSAKPDVQPHRLEKRIFELINDERVRAKLPPLQLEPKLSEIGRAHSEDMARNRYLAHVNPQGMDPTQRARAAGFECRNRVGRITYTGVAENIYQNNLYHRAVTSGTRTTYEWNSEEKIATASVRGWMDSSGHRANILNARYTRTGVGVSFAADQKVYITQEFC